MPDTPKPEAPADEPTFDGMTGNERYSLQWLDLWIRGGGIARHMACGGPGLDGLVRAKLARISDNPPQKLSVVTLTAAGKRMAAKWRNASWVPPE
jgi:hypothetical protein